MGYSLTVLGMGARNPSSAAVPGTKGKVALGLGLRKLQARALDLKVLEEASLKQPGVPTGGTLWKRHRTRQNGLLIFVVFFS